MINIIPKTKFPTEPVDRWTDWTGLLFPNDERHIFTESVCKYLYYNTVYRNTFKEEIDAGEIITKLYEKFKRICADPSEEMRLIKVSIKARMFYFLKNYMKKFFQTKRNREKSDEHKFRLLYQNRNHKEEDQIFWDREFENTFYEALNSLPDMEKEIIVQKITGKDTSKIARALGIERHVAEKLLNKAAHTIDTFVKAQMLDSYRR